MNGQVNQAKITIMPNALINNDSVHELTLEMNPDNLSIVVGDQWAQEKNQWYFMTRCWGNVEERKREGMSTNDLSRIEMDNFCWGWSKDISSWIYYSTIPNIWCMQDNISEHVVHFLDSMGAQTNDPDMFKENFPNHLQIEPTWSKAKICACWEHLTSLFNTKFFCFGAKFKLVEQGRTHQYFWEDLDDYVKWHYEKALEFWQSSCRGCGSRFFPPWNDRKLLDQLAELIFSFILAIYGSCEADQWMSLRKPWNPPWWIRST